MCNISICVMWLYQMPGKLPCNLREGNWINQRSLLSTYRRNALLPKTGRKQNKQNFENCWHMAHLGCPAQYAVHKTWGQNSIPSNVMWQAETRRHLPSSFFQAYQGMCHRARHSSVHKPKLPGWQAEQVANTSCWPYYYKTGTWSLCQEHIAEEEPSLQISKPCDCCQTGITVQSKHSTASPAI